MCGWAHEGPGLAYRAFTGTVREAAGFQVYIEGIQRENATCERRVAIAADAAEALLDREAARQLAAALVSAADEIEAR